MIKNFVRAVLAITFAVLVAACGGSVKAVEGHATNTSHTGEVKAWVTHNVYKDVKKCKNVWNTLTRKYEYKCTTTHTKVDTVKKYEQVAKAKYRVEVNDKWYCTDIYTWSKAQAADNKIKFYPVGYGANC